MANLPPGAQYVKDSLGNTTALSSSHGPIPLSRGFPKGRMIFLGDSLSWQACQLRGVGLFDGRTWSTGSQSTFSAQWLATGWPIVDGTNTPANTAVAGGTLQTDGNGKLQWKMTGDSSYGPYVDCSAGGFFYLQTGTPASYGGCMVATLVSGTKPAAGTSAVTAGSFPNIWDWDPRGYPFWVASAFGGTFKDYEVYGAQYAQSSDILAFANQLSGPNIEVICINAGTNDIPATAAAALASVVTLKSIIDVCRTKANMVFVADIFPRTDASATATVQKYLQLVSSEIKAYCETLQNVVFWSGYNQVIDPVLSTVTEITGMYSDLLHTKPFGGYYVSQPLVSAIKSFYPVQPTRHSRLDTWDSTMGIGAINTNPSLRGTAGTVTGSTGYTGSAPDGWTVNRTGSTQTVTLSQVAATDGGDSWLTWNVAAATANDTSFMTQSPALPAGLNVGDFIRLSFEMQIGAVTGSGIAQLQVYWRGFDVSSHVTQFGYPIQSGTVYSSVNIANFGTELPICMIQTEPQKLLAATASFTVRFTIGLAVGATAVIGIRNLRLEKYQPNIAIYP